MNDSRSNEIKWYVAHTYSGYERNAANAIAKAVSARSASEHMNELIIETMVPTEMQTEISEDGKRKEVERLKYPGYVFIKMAATNARAWHLVRNVRGVTGFVGEENKPVPLTDEEINTIGVERKDAVIETKYTVGDLVSILDGPMEGFEGKVTEIDSQANSVKVLVSMFGRDTEAELELNKIRKIKYETNIKYNS
jgi:transcriptional antiterminator NusG